jgi:predicted Zn-dependent protease with MMP-like domain
MAFPISDSDFETIVKGSIENIPNLYKENLDSVAFFVEEEPTKEQAKMLKLRPCDSLFGLFEGVPKTENDGGYALTLPSRITIFKKAHEDNADSLKSLTVQVNDSLWHEVAHYYGLSHADMAKIKRN